MFTGSYGVISQHGKIDSFLHEMIMFNHDDVIRESGHVIELSINFASLPRRDSSTKIFLYVLSIAKDKDQFVIVHRHQIPDDQIRGLIGNSAEDSLQAQLNTTNRQDNVSRAFSSAFC